MGISSTVDLMAGNLLQEGVHGTGGSMARSFYLSLSESLSFLILI